MTRAMDGTSTALAPAASVLRRPAVWAALAVLAITAVRVAFLAVSDLNLFVDEAQYWAWSRTLAFGYFSKPPLIAWLIAGTTALCGNGEACVRLPSPLFYAGTSAVLFVLGRAMYDERVGAWAAVLFATLPGVSFSAIIISTDVPLLFFWAGALLALWRLVNGGGSASAVMLGLMLGLATLSKYAGAYFLLCVAAYMVADRTARTALLSRRGALALAVALVVIAPNVAWNAMNGFATIGHTAGLAVGDGPSFSVLKVLEFYGAQFGVFGPLPFAALTVLAARWAVRRADPRERLLLCFALPVLGLMLAEAFVARAYANWAAVAFVSASVLVAATLARDWPRWLAPTALLHAGGAVFAYAFLASGAGLAMFTFGGTDPIDRVTGWDRLAAEVAARAHAYPQATIMTDDRTLTAALLYYMRIDLREGGRRLVAWHPLGSDAMVTGMAPLVDRETGRDVLYLPVAFVPGDAAARFARREDLPPVEAPAHSGRMRVIPLMHLQDYRGP
jgi:4-amino-4-deoxy-L-arabinose transferase-like glycosyltransferase